MARITGGSNLVVVAANNILSLYLDDKLTKTLDIGTLISTSENTPAEDKSKFKKPQTDVIQVLCLALSSDSAVLAVAASNKIIYFLNPKTLEVLRFLRVPKAPTSCVFDKNNEYLVVGDRAGHVRRYLVEKEMKISERDITGELCEHEGEALSGSISMVLDVHISSEHNYLLAADRDEKVRISNYPKAFVIEAFCLGHVEYVASVDSYENRLFSAGGDGLIFEWDIKTGQVVKQSESVNKPFKKVRHVVGEKENEKLLCAFCSDDSIIYIFDYLNQNSIKLVKEIPVKDNIHDIVVVGETVYALTRSSLVKIEIVQSNAEILEVSKLLVPQLEDSKEPIASFFKNVTHKNMEEYEKRKAERMAKEEEKKNAKKRRLEEKTNA